MVTETSLQMPHLQALCGTQGRAPKASWPSPHVQMRSPRPRDLGPPWVAGQVWAEPGLGHRAGTPGQVLLGRGVGQLGVLGWRCGQRPEGA